jgi:DNA polymerase-3 subunit gamma/tau
VCGADSELIAATADQRPALARAAALFGEEDLTRFFQILLQTDDSLRRAPDPRVHLEMGLLRLINAARLAPLEELLGEMKGGSNGGGAPSSGASRGAVTSVAGAPKKMFAESAGAATRSDSGIRATASLDAERQRPEMRSETAKQDDDLQRAGAEQSPAASSLAASAPPSEESQEDRLKTAATNAPAASKAILEAGPSAEPSAEGITAEQVVEIKAAIQAEKKFLGELVEQSSRWQVEGTELRIFFPVEKRAFAELLEGREALEKIRASVAKVLGRPLRVCARIESLAAAAAAGAGGTLQNGARESSSNSGPNSAPFSARGTEPSFARPAAQDGAASAELRARFERDPMVRAMIERFGGKISEVKPRPAEP